jgi:hypothetical protein
MPLDNNTLGMLFCLLERRWQFSESLSHFQETSAALSKFITTENMFINPQNHSIIISRAALRNSLYSTIHCHGCLNGQQQTVLP